MSQAKILELLKKKKVADVDYLARTLKLSKGTINRSMYILYRFRLVDRDLVPEQKKVGKYVYWLTKKAIKQTTLPKPRKVKRLLWRKRCIKCEKRILSIDKDEEFFICDDCKNKDYEEV